jgi:hypothetical protein
VLATFSSSYRCLLCFANDLAKAAVREKRDVAHLMNDSQYGAFVALAIALCLLPPALVAQAGERMEPPITVKPKPAGVTPRTPDGHPDFTGV